MSILWFNNSNIALTDHFSFSTLWVFHTKDFNIWFFEFSHQKICLHFEKSAVCLQKLKSRVFSDFCSLLSSLPCSLITFLWSLGVISRILSIEKTGIMRLYSWIQGVPFEKWQKWKALTQKQCMSDFILVKPKCVWTTVNICSISKTC